MAVGTLVPVAAAVAVPADGVVVVEASAAGVPLTAVPLACATAALEFTAFAVPTATALAVAAAAGSVAPGEGVPEADGVAAASVAAGVGVAVGTSVGEAEGSPLEAAAGSLLGWLAESADAEAFWAGKAAAAALAELWLAGFAVGVVRGAVVARGATAPAEGLAVGAALDWTVAAGAAASACCATAVGDCVPRAPAAAFAVGVALVFGGTRVAVGGFGA